jgi:ATP-binding cassette, subfamily C, bacterial CydCD
MSPASARRPAALGAKGRRRVLAAAALGVSGELCALGLLATGGWLLLSAALRPPILTLSVAIGAVQVFALSRGAARYGERLASHDLGLGLQARLRAWLYRQLERLVPAGLPGGSRGDLLARLISDTGEVQDLAVRAAVPFAVTAATWAAAAAAAAALLPAAGAALLAAGLLGASGVAAATVLAGRTSAGLPAARGAVGGWALQALTSAEELVALGAGDWAVARLAACERELGARTRAVAAAAGLGRAMATFAGGAALAGVVWAGGTALRAGRIGAPELGALAFLALGVAVLLQGLPDAMSRLPVSQAALRRLAGIGVLPDPVPGPVPRPAAGDPGRAASPRAAGGGAVRIVLRGAAVAYPGGGTPGAAAAVAGVDLDLAPGRPVALAGPSGSGKTAAVLALLRFVGLTAGEMTVNGADAAGLPPDQLRALIAWSPEQPVLFPSTVRANLRLGAPHATDAQIAGLLADLGLASWLEQLDAGLDTVLAPWGHPVSGGELQRLSVARAILADRPVLLLDEPTSHLDRAAADAVLAAVLDRTRQRSLLWVTHRTEELAAFPRAVDLGRLPVSPPADRAARPPDRP